MIRAVEEIMAKKEISVKKYVVRLSAEERQRLDALIRKVLGQEMFRPDHAQVTLSAARPNRLKTMPRTGPRAVVRARARPNGSSPFQNADLI